MPSYELFENGNDHFLIAMIVSLVEKNELLNLFNSRAVCQLTGIKSVGRNLHLAKFYFDNYS